MKSATRLPGLWLITAFFIPAFSLMAQQYQPRLTPDGHPNIQGNWSNATLTTFERSFGQGPLYTQAEVDQLEGRRAIEVTVGGQSTDPDRAPPPVSEQIGRSYNEIY